MRNKQRGITFLGLLFLVAFVGSFVYAGIRLVPVYLEYMSISHVFDGLAAETHGAVTEGTLRTAIGQRLELEDADSLDPRDVEISRDGGVWTVRAAYSRETSFIGNVSFVVHFDKLVEVPAT